MALVTGYRDCSAWSFSFGINSLKTSCYEVGLFNRMEGTEDGKQVQVFTIGLLFFFIEMEFFKTY